LSKKQTVHFHGRFSFSLPSVLTDGKMLVLFFIAVHCRWFKPTAMNGNETALKVLFYTFV